MARIHDKNTGQEGHPHYFTDAVHLEMCKLVVEPIVVGTIVVEPIMVETTSGGTNNGGNNRSGTNRQ